MNKEQSTKKGPFMRACEIAEILNISTSTVYRLAQAGVIPRVSIGRSVRFCMGDVLATLANKQVDIQNNKQEGE